MSGQGEMSIDPRHEAAVNWFVRRRTASADTAAAFQAWLDAAPENADAYADVERVWGDAADAGEDPEIVARRRAMAARRRMPRRAIAASLAAAVVGLSSLGAYELLAPRTLADQAFRTGVGQQATVSLPDGSVVTLNTDTVVRTRADGARRLVYLDKGQAFFKVAHDRRRPFIVTAAGRTVTALGTAFDVRVDHGSLKVVLVEGKVRVQGPPPRPTPGKPPLAAPALATEMTPGSELVAPDDAEWRLTRADAVQETSWTRGLIVFDHEPLGAVVEELNRYSTRKIVLADAKLGEVRLSGVFRPGDLDGFALALKTSGLGEVSGDSDTEFRIVALK